MEVFSNCSNLFSVLLTSFLFFGFLCRPTLSFHLFPYLVLFTVSFVLMFFTTIYLNNQKVYQDVFMMGVKKKSNVVVFCHR